MDIQIVQAFQMLGSGFMDVVFGAFYYLLNPLVTMIVPIILYYIIDKRLAYRVGVFYGVTSFFCGTLKEIIKRDRPYIAHADKVSPRIDGNAKGTTTASGASMPSGHAMGSIGLLYPAAKQYGLGEKRRIYVIIIAAFVVMMVGFSRVYMAGHYLTDVLVGWGIGFIIAVGIDFALTKLKDRFYLFSLLILPVMVILIFILPESDSCGVGLAFTSAVLLGGFLDHKFIKLEISAKWWVKALRTFIAINGAFIGLLIVSKAFEAGLGYALTEISEVMPLELAAQGVGQAEAERTVKSVTAAAYFLMFFAANAWAYIVCPPLFKYVPIWCRKITNRKKDETN